MSRFPDFFPEDCPPDSAKPEENNVFRLTRNPIEEKDFLSQHLLGGKREHPSCKCAKYGISVFTSYDDVKKLQKCSPHMRKKSISRGKTLPGYGIISKTPWNYKSHCTWYLYEGVNPYKDFEIIKNE